MVEIQFACYCIYWMLILYSPGILITSNIDLDLHPHNGLFYGRKTFYTMRTFIRSTDTYQVASVCAELLSELR